jgi:hypothetical protein
MIFSSDGTSLRISSALARISSSCTKIILEPELFMINAISFSDWVG